MCVCVTVPSSSDLNQHQCVYRVDWDVGVAIG